MVPHSKARGLFLNFAALAVLISATCSWVCAQPRVVLESLVSSLSEPDYITSAHDGSNRLFIVEQGGTIRVLEPRATAATLFLDITPRVLSGGERGLLGLAFHPQFAANRRFFVNYTRRPDGATVVAEYQDGIEKILFTVAQPFENHNGGMIEFGPDGYLYIGMGDGGSANDPMNRAQNLNDFLGKILRINVDVPNPRPEIFAYGFRNPWRFSFDRATGQLYVGDVGQGAREEIDVVTQGGNYGWRVWEGNFCTGLGPAPCSAAGFIPPIAEYVNGQSGRCAIIGGYVYRGKQATLPIGAYIYGDSCSGEIFMLNDGAQTVLADTTFAISSFGEDESGEIYVVDLNGSISRISNPDVVRDSQRMFATAEGRAFVTSTVAAGRNTTAGYAHIQANVGQPLPWGQAILGFEYAGVLVSETSIPASHPIVSGRTLAEIDANVNTGLVLANPNGQAITVSFYFTDVDGSTVRQGTTAIPANGQIAAFLSDPPFRAGSLFGTFTFTSSLPIIATALRMYTNDRGEPLFSTLPVLEPGVAPPPTIVPQFIQGGGWRTDIVLMNYGDTAVNGTVEFVRANGETLQAFPYVVPSRGAVDLGLMGFFSNIQTGFVRVSSGVSALAIVSYVANGVTLTQTSVPAIPAGTAFQVFAYGTDVVRTGIAIANASRTDAADVNLQVAGFSSTLSIPPTTQRSFFFDELPIASQSVLRITSNIPIATAGFRIRANERGELLVTSTVTADEAQSVGSGDLFFPEFAAGGGFRTEFIVFGKTSTGTIYFYDQDGAPSNLLFLTGL
jgi:Glucose / Sorbosone dehydrogenase